MFLEPVIGPTNIETCRLGFAALKLEANRESQHNELRRLSVRQLKGEVWGWIQLAAVL